MTHLIRRQYLEVEVNGTQADGLALQRSLPDTCRQALLPVLAKVLDQYAPATGHWYIERLDIDAGALPLSKFESQIGSIIGQALNKALQEMAAAMDTVDELASAPAAIVTHVAHLARALLYFLQTGTLPWNFRLPEGMDLEQAVRTAWKEQEPTIEGRQAFAEKLTALLRHPLARRRLVRQFTVEFLHELLFLLSDDLKTVQERVLSDLYRGSKAAEVAEFSLILWETAFAKAAHRQPLSERSLLSEAQRVAAARNVLSDKVQEQIQRRWPDLARQETDEVPFKEREASEVKSISDPTGRGGEPQEDEAYYIDNAGLVLLHPFLPRLMEGTGIAAGGELLSPERAMVLLHYLATGRKIAPEYELILPKLLCNWPLDMPTAADVGLTAQEIEEANALLEAVIGHWGALGNTSVDGLRGNFLLRPGKLSLLNEEEWKLEVENRTYDILLDQLPWGIGLVKLPWMEIMLQTEWR